MFPRGLKDRVVAECQEKYWDSDHKKAQAKAIKKQQESDKGDKDVDSLSLVEKLAKENSEAEVEMVQSLDKKF